MKGKRKITLKVFVLFLAASLGMALLLNTAAVFEDVLLATHLKLTKPPQKQSNIVLILAGNRSMEELRQWPWPRGYYTDLLSTSLDGARTVVLDVLFAEYGDEKEDAAFCDAIREHGGVVLAEASGENGHRTVSPIPELYKAAAAIGFTSYTPDHGDMTARHTFAKFVQGESAREYVLPSLVCAALSVNGNLRSLKKGEALFVDDGGRGYFGRAVSGGQRVYRACGISSAQGAAWPEAVIHVAFLPLLLCGGLPPAHQNQLVAARVRDGRRFFAASVAVSKKPHVYSVISRHDRRRGLLSDCRSL
ncbi:CHASE2 domain-containing protein [Christensenellaceae bacterium OttesenSCG-928-M15]|nr:CHASE2 domain-containing protein [Christensenellaceae bacterium OttesenSCG-928-M15]